MKISKIDMWKTKKLKMS